METINQISLIIYIGIIALSLFLHHKNSKNAVFEVNTIADVKFSRIYTFVIPFSIILIGAALRLYMLPSIPSGLHQDEASIGYEAFILSEYGIDRDGNHLPIYPITYGSGGGSPLMIYLNALNTNLFGCSPLVLRALPAVLGVVTLAVFYFLIKTLSSDALSNTRKSIPLQRISGEYLWVPLVSMTIMALSPWHIMLSRWSLDCNTTPFWLISALLMLTLGIVKSKKGTAFFILSAILYSLTLYSYGSATIVIPIHLLIICIICIKNGRMSKSQLITGVIVFLVCSLPLIIFYVINLFDLPEIITPLFSITKFTARRSVFVSGSGLFTGILQNFMVMVKNITIGNPSEQILNYIPGFPPLLAFTFPMTILGLVLSIIRTRKGNLLDQMITSLFFPAFIFGLFVEEDITRMVLIFIPLIYYMARGFVFTVDGFVTVQKASIHKTGRFLAIFAKALTPALFMACAFLFAKEYFTEYDRINADAFMPGYGEACVYADESVSEGSLIYSTYEHVSAPFMVALYYTKTPPKDFISTVHYKDPDSEFRIADSFTHFRFFLPDDLEEKIATYLEGGNVFILHKTQLSSLKKLSGYNSANVKLRLFYDFVVISKD